jgi:amidase
VSSDRRSALPIFSTLLSAREIELTSTQDATALLEQIHARKGSAEEVTSAFCKRAAITHQLVRCLMDIDFEGAIARAKELDEHFNRTGKVVGPLHGLPVSIKVRILSQ